MYTNKDGFLLSDACVGVLIVSLCAFLAASVMEEHYKEESLLKEKMEEIEDRFEIEIERTEQCNKCEVDSPS